MATKSARGGWRRRGQVGERHRGHAGHRALVAAGLVDGGVVGVGVLLGAARTHHGAVHPLAPHVRRPAEERGQGHGERREGQREGPEGGAR
jgi:hypothetical protein